jgi:hypothetical protein
MAPSASLELENERPETLAGWKQCFEQAGFRHVVADDRSALFRLSLEQFTRQVGFFQRLKLLSVVVRKWGVRGLIRVLRSVRTFRSPFLGYARVVGQKYPKVSTVGHSISGQMMRLRIRISLGGWTARDGPRRL